MLPIQRATRSTPSPSRRFAASLQLRIEITILAHPSPPHYRDNRETAIRGEAVRRPPPGDRQVPVIADRVGDRSSLRSGLVALVGDSAVIGGLGSRLDRTPALAR